MKGLLNRITQFFKDVQSELKKVSFPTRAETLGSTTVVLILVFIVGIFLSLMDLALVKVIKSIIQ